MKSAKMARWNVQDEFKIMFITNFKHCLYKSIASSKWYSETFVLNPRIMLSSDGVLFSSLSFTIYFEDCALILRQSTNCNQKHGGFCQITSFWPHSFFTFMLKTNDQLYLSSKNNFSHTPDRCQKVESRIPFHLPSKYSVFLFWYLISCQLFVHFLSVKTAMGERVQATYPRTGNLFILRYYLFKHVFKRNLIFVQDVT